MLWPLPQNRKDGIFGNGVAWGCRLPAELLEDTDSGKANILVELDHLCWRIPAAGWRAGMMLRINDFALANNLVAILCMLKLLRKIIGSTGPAAYEKTIFGPGLSQGIMKA